MVKQLSCDGSKLDMEMLPDVLFMLYIEVYTCMHVVPRY